MSFAGNLKMVSFGDALQLISTGKRTGALHLKRPNRNKTIFFCDGSVIAAASSPPLEEERLGQLLLHRGEITPDDLTRALKRQRGSGKRLGRTLVDLDLITGTALASILRHQVEEIVYSIFGWPEGEFHFVEGEKPDSSDIPVQLNTLNIMMEGARRYDEYTQIVDALPGDDTVLRLSAIPHLPDGEISLTDGDGGHRWRAHGGRNCLCHIPGGICVLQVSPQTDHRRAGPVLSPSDKCQRASERAGRGLRSGV